MLNHSTLLPMSYRLSARRPRGAASQNWQHRLRPKSFLREKQWIVSPPTFYPLQYSSSLRGLRNCFKLKQIIFFVVKTRQKVRKNLDTCITFYVFLQLCWSHAGFFPSTCWQWWWKWGFSLPYGRLRPLPAARNRCRAGSRRPSLHTINIHHHSSRRPIRVLPAASHVEYAKARNSKSGPEPLHGAADPWPAGGATTVT